VARPREFDEEKVLDLVVEPFSERGYEATSIHDLAQAMVLTTASVYDAFGDKRAVYCKAPNHDVDRVGRFESEPPRDAIGAFFAEISDRSLDDIKRKDSMLVNSALEAAPQSGCFLWVYEHHFPGRLPAMANCAL
jgi:TetR/AcrR family transcriptional regulator, transcriptional repressor for nem operon